MSQGDIAETDFLARATKRGFRMSQPWGTNCRYDSILDNGLTRFLIQVKSTSCLRRKNVYMVRSGRRFGIRHPRMVPYVDSEIDFVVIYILPEDTWYIIPIEVLRGRVAINIYSRYHKRKGEWEPFRENWDLFRQDQTPEVAKLMRAIREKTLKK